MMRKKPNYGPSNISSSEIEITEEIKKDSTRSHLYKGKCRNFAVCVKVPQNQELTPEELLSFKNEVAVSSQFYHPNICLFLGACEEQGNIKIVHELMDGSLADILYSGECKNTYSLSTRIKWAKDAALGITWLHGNPQPVILRELKTSNILHDNALRFKVSIFTGTQFRKIDENQNYSVRSKLYFAPEIIFGKEVTEKADVYSFGVVLYEILTCSKLYPDLKSDDEFSKLLENRLEFEFPENCPNSLKDLILGCTNIDPRQRPCFNLIVDRLDVIIEETANLESLSDITTNILDENGRSFWKKYFLGENKPSWDTFAVSFYEFIEQELPRAPVEPPLPEKPTSLQVKEASLKQLDAFAMRGAEEKRIAEEERQSRSQSGYFQPLVVKETSPELRQFLCLESLLVAENIPCSPSCGVVTLENFGKVLGWFGPLERSKGGENLFLRRIEDVLQYPWFHGNISAQQSEQLLNNNNRKVGDYLVRFSTRSFGSFVISKLTDKTILHSIVRYKPGEGFHLQSKPNEVFPSLPSLISHMQSKNMLNNFCPGSKFLQLGLFD